MAKPGMCKMMPDVPCGCIPKQPGHWCAHSLARHERRTAEAQARYTEFGEAQAPMGARVVTDPAGRLPSEGGPPQREPGSSPGLAANSERASNEAQTCPHGTGMYRCDDSDECKDSQARASRPNEVTPDWEPPVRINDALTLAGLKNLWEVAKSGELPSSVAYNVQLAVQEIHDRRCREKGPR